MSNEYIKYNPWNLNRNNNVFNKSHQILIYGPISKNRKKEYIQFRINRNLDNLEILTTEVGETGFNNLYMKIDLNSKVAKIVSLEKSSIYSGRDFMYIGLKILKNLEINKVTLIDNSKINCNNRSSRYLNGLITKDIQFNIISLLKDKKTYYMNFGFKPYINNVNIEEQLKEIVERLYQIKWSDIENILSKGEKTIKFIKEGEKNILINQLGRVNIDQWILYWSIIRKSYNEFFSIYKDIYDSPFLALKHFSKNKCKIFIDWLELYSLNAVYFKDITLYKFYNNNGISKNIIIPGKNEIKILLKLLRTIEWKIIDLKEINIEYNYNGRPVV
jgi:hypothetical protein